MGLNRYVHRKFLMIWLVGMSIIGVVPFDFDWKKRRMRVSKCVRKRILSHIALVLFFCRFALTTFRLFQVASSWRSHMHEICPISFYCSIYMNNFFYMLNFLRNGKRITWCFNQVSKMVEGTEGWNSRKKLSLPEFVILTWLPGHFDLVFKMVLMFKVSPTALHQVFSLLPLPLQEKPSVFTVFVFLEFFTAFFFICTSLAEFSLHVYLIEGFKHASAMLRIEMAESNCVAGEKSSEVITKYRQLQIVVREFTIAFGRSIERTKSSFTAFTILSNFILIRYGNVLSKELYRWVANVGSFTGTLPPLLYNSAYKLHDLTIEVKRLLALKSVQEPDGKQFQNRKKTRSLKPLKIMVAGIYFLDRSFTPMYYDIILSVTISLLVS